MVTHDNDQLYMNTSLGLGRALSMGEIRFSVFIRKKLYFQEGKPAAAGMRKVPSGALPAFKPTPPFPDDSSNNVRSRPPDLSLSSDYVFLYVIFFLLPPQGAFYSEKAMAF